MTADKTIRLADFDKSELRLWLTEKGLIEPDGHAWRSDQIFSWLGRGARSFDEMTNLPRDLRAALAQTAITGIPEVVGARHSERDGTVKYALKMSDGCIVESVLMRYKHGDSICVSSQAGCRMGCAFCATKPGSFARDLTPGEMYGQVILAGQIGRIGNVVVMGVGEPFNNYDNTLKFIRLLHEHPETGIGYRKVAISTCGILPGILRLAEEGLPIGLSVSLHAPRDTVRSSLMPVNHSFSIDKLLEACKIYTCKTKRRVTFEYALIEGINDAPDDAFELLRRVRGMLCHINLIPVNNTGDSSFKPSSKEGIKRFAGILENGGAQVTVRRRLGSDIMAACGQLRNTMSRDEG